MRYPIFALLVWSLCVFHSMEVHAVNLEAAFEQPCNPKEGFITQNFENWIAEQNVTLLYFPMMSQLDAIRITQCLTKSKDVSSIHKAEIDASCLTVKPGPDGFEFSGFPSRGGLKAVKHFTMTEPKLFTAPPTFPGDETTTLRISLTDNKSYQVAEICWGDLQRSFAVLSSKPYLTPCEKKVIEAHLLAIGYKKEFFYGIHYERCGLHLRGRAMPEFRGFF